MKTTLTPKQYKDYQQLCEDTVDTTVLAKILTEKSPGGFIFEKIFL